MAARCLLDLDGVLADFISAAFVVHGVDPVAGLAAWPKGEYSVETVLGITAKEFWTKIQDAAGFWENLKPTPDCFEIIAAAEKRFGQENVCVLTSPPSDPSAAAGKMRWIAEYMPAYRRRFLIGPAKEFCASPSSVLVDDSEKNTDKFVAAGGRVVLVPQPWNMASPASVPQMIESLSI